MKCLPSSKLSNAQGNILHDWHAEILAIRAFNCFVLDECRALTTGSKSTSEFIRRRSSAEMTATPGFVVEDDDSADWHGQPFAWREDVLLHMYCSEAPCTQSRDKNKLAIFSNLFLIWTEYSRQSQAETQAWNSPWRLKQTQHHGPSQRTHRRRHLPAPFLLP